MSYSAMLWALASYASLSMGDSPGKNTGVGCHAFLDLLDPGIKPASPATPELQTDSLLLSHRGTQGSYLVLVKRDTGSNDWTNQTLESFFSLFYLTTSGGHIHCRDNSHFIIVTIVSTIVSYSPFTMTLTPM